MGSLGKPRIAIDFLKDKIECLNIEIHVQTFLKEEFLWQ